MAYSRNKQITTATAQSVRQSENNTTILLRLGGEWSIHSRGVDASGIINDISSDSSLRELAFDSSEISQWDSSLITFLLKVIEESLKAGIKIDTSGLPDGVNSLIKLAQAVPERSGARKSHIRQSVFYRIGSEVETLVDETKQMLSFTGESFIALKNLFRGKARLRLSDLFLEMQEVGIQALPIVSLISLLVGLIFAFIGSIQLKIFGAEIYVASLVGIAMVRAMGAIMTGIIMAGRTGAAFAAQIGTMQVNEEIDALKTMGISPMEFLVLPRLIALAIMMPLLCLYANLMGIIGGMVVGVGLLGLNPIEYFYQTQATIGLKDIAIGVFMSAVFGVLVAMAGCMRGMQCTRSASAVGLAATSAVVTGIVSIIISTAIITIVVNILGI